MVFKRTAPITWIIAAVAGGVIFAVGGIATAVSTTPRYVMAAGTVAFVALGAYAISLLHRNTALNARNDELEGDADALRRADASLRTRMAYTLRDPLTSIVGFADRMVDAPDLPFDERREMMVAIRADALEVERVLSDLADLTDSLDTELSIGGVVLLGEELASIASTITTNAIFESDLSRSRAWGDSAKVRQVIRTILNAVTDSGCAFITLQSNERSGRASATVSGRDDLLTPPAIAAITGNTQTEDRGDETYRALRTAYELAASMGGSIGYAQAFGVTHIVLDLPAVPSDVGVTTPRVIPTQNFEIPFASAVELRPERPTSSIRFV
ncbi:MAG: hypothetical protein ABFR95_06515 [Actinomycetota bacterium]